MFLPGDKNSYTGIVFVTKLALHNRAHTRHKYATHLVQSLPFFVSLPFLVKAFFLPSLALKPKTPVTHGGPAAKAGASVSDIVVSIDGSTSLVTYKDLIQTVDAIGPPVGVGFERGGGDAREGTGSGGRDEEPGQLQRAQATLRTDERKEPPQVRSFRYRSSGAIVMCLFPLPRRRLFSICTCSLVVYALSLPKTHGQSRGELCRTNSPHMFHASQ